MDKHWQEPHKQTLFVEIDLDCLLDSIKESIVFLDLLMTGRLAAQNWTSQRCDIQLKPTLVAELEALWFTFLAMPNTHPPSILISVKQPHNSSLGGSPKQVTLTRLNVILTLTRRAYSITVVCRFNSEETYGALGKEFIHVHHLTQVAHIGKEYAVD